MQKLQKTWLTIGISLGIVLLYTGLIIYPQTSNILDLNNKIYQEKIRQEGLKIQENDIKQAKDKEQNIDTILDQLSIHLTTKDDIVNFIVDLENIAKQTNNEQTINILEQTNAPQIKKTEKEDTTNTDTSTNTSVTTNPTQANPTNNFIEVEVKLQGSFEDLVAYLNELKKATTLTDETSLDSQLAELATTKTSTQVVQNEAMPTTSELSTTLNLKVFIKDQNATK
ncbi:MAG: hypothetical protein WC663_00405 [Patescibacteria group bacterium]|jgi:hypothetical protein